MEDSEAKDRILKGAEQLFCKYGIRSISMDDIARHLGISKKTIYQYFADKDEVVTLASKLHLERNEKEFEEIRRSSANAIEELTKISVCLKKDMEEMNPTLLFDIQKYHPKAWAVYLAFKEQVLQECIGRNLLQGIEEGYFRPEINREIIGRMRLALVEIAFDSRHFPPDKFKLAEVQLHIFDHFVHGLVTEKGRKLYIKYKQKVNHTTQPSTIL